MEDMVHHRFLLAAPLLLALSAPAASQPLHSSDGPYVEFSGGYVSLSDVDGDVGGVDAEVEYNDGFAIGAQLGYKQNAFRVALEFEYGRAGFDSVSVGGVEANVDGDFDIYRGTAGLYYDFDNNSGLTPYVGGGLGAAYVDVEDTTIAGVTFEGDSDTYFTAHGEAGLSFAATERVAIVPAYRFIWFDSSESGFEDDTAHLFKVGLRFRF